MQSFMDALYSYVQEDQVPCYLQTTEYRRVISELEECWEEFRSMLTEEQWERLDKLLLQEAKISRLEDEAAFCSALSIGLSLGRL